MQSHGFLTLLFLIEVCLNLVQISACRLNSLISFEALFPAVLMFAHNLNLKSRPNK